MLNKIAKLQFKTKLAYRKSAKQKAIIAFLNRCFTVEKLSLNGPILASLNYRLLNFDPYVSGGTVHKKFAKSPQEMQKSCTGNVTPLITIVK